jgi:murein DD-endopeptidase MepM/ murein hydrolase activator NlpD
VLTVPVATGEPTAPFAAASVTALLAQDLQAAIPTATPIIQGADVKDWNPPAIAVPVAHSPWDHYWFIRPVAAKYTNFALKDYPFGSNGPQNDLRIHHGIDLPNPIGVEVLAAGDGTIISAQKGHINEFESITSYGNCIVIDHDFGYNGDHVYTLYAHLSAILVQKGDHVHSGQVIGLIGNTGQVTGPHVHFEVRIGRDSYFSVRNPILWMAPYVGTGVIAGRVAFADNSTADDASVTLIDLATGKVVDQTTTYGGFGVNGDDHWKENFVFSDIPVGHYLVTSNYNTTTWAGAVDVIPAATDWVEMTRYTAETMPLAPPPTP